jgi:methionyl-tRNA synthetase
MPTLLVHGWWNIAGAKMSKSLGNIVDPDLLADKYGPEALRYYLMSDIATGRDADFSEERLIQRYNSDLANSVGNLLNRSLNMAAKYRNAVLQKTEVLSLETEKTADGYLGFVNLNYKVALEGRYEKRSGTKEDPDELWDAYMINIAIAMALNVANCANQLVQRTEPWTLAKAEKAGDANARQQLDAVLYTLAESLRIIAILIWPVLPDAAHGIFDQLAWKLDEAGKDSRFRLADAVWGGLPDGHVFGKPVPLFPRIEAPAPAAEQ